MREELEHLVAGALGGDDAIVEPDAAVGVAREDEALEVNLGLLDADYEWVTSRLMEVAARHCQGRLISCLEGGYELSPLGRSAAAHVKVLIGAD